MVSTLQKKIFITYALPLLLSLLLLSGISYGLLRQTSEAAQRQHLVHLATRHAESINALLRERIAALERVETLDYRYNYRDLMLIDHFSRFAGSLPVLSYLDLQGREQVKVVEGQKSPQLHDYSNDPWFNGALQRPNQVSFGSLSRSADLERLVLPFGVARYNYFGDEFAGFLRAELPLLELTGSLLDIAVGQTGYVILLDSSGSILYHPDARLRFRQLPGSESLRQLLKDEQAEPSRPRLVELPGGRALVARGDISPLGWTLLVALPHAEYIAPALRLASYALGTALVALLLGLLLARRIARPFDHNLQRIIEHTALLGADRLDTPLELRSGDELESLAASLNRMARNLARSLDEQASLQDILQSLSDPLVVLDPDFHILKLNEAARDLLGGKPEQLIGEPLAAFLGASPEAANQLLRQVCGSGSLRNHETELDTADGRRVPVLLSCSTPDPTINAEIGLVAIFKDISERKQVEAARRRELTFSETLLAQSPIGIRVFDGATGHCLSANPAAARIAGGPVAALLEQNFRDIAPWRQAGLTEVAEAVLADGTPRQVNKEFLTTFGKQQNVRYFLARFLVDDQPLLMVLGQDIREETRLAEENRRIEEQMLHAQKLESLGVLAGGIAHDFNNILTTVLGNAELALRQLPAEAPVSRHLDQIQQAAEQAARLAGQMLAYSGKGRFVIEPLDLNRTIEEMLHMLEVSIAKNVRLHFQPDPDSPVVEADATQLRQVVMNLVINASEAIGAANGLIELTTGSMLRDNRDLGDHWQDDELDAGTCAYLEVSDSGCGMDQETLERIFDPFFSTKFAGRGLGMAAVFGIVRGHQGAIRVSSQPGRGSTFRVLLPRAGAAAKSADPAPADPPWQGAGRVLLVDDEASVRQVGKFMLEELGYEVLTAEHGREALRIFQAQGQSIRLVIMDLTMPELDGEAAYRELRCLDPAVKVIIISGYTEQEVARRFENQGRLGFLQKPFRLAALQSALRAIDGVEPALPATAGNTDISD